MSGRCLPIQQFRKITVLLLVMCLSWLSLSTPRYLATPKAARLGYLTKVGQEYQLIWKNTDSDYEKVIFSQYAHAHLYAVNQLGLKTSTLTLQEIENVWVEQSVNGYHIFWKSNASPHLNRWTVNLKKEAQQIAHLIKFGAYTPSPFGHSLLYSH